MSSGLCLLCASCKPKWRKSKQMALYVPRTHNKAEALEYCGKL